MSTSTPWRLCSRAPRTRTYGSWEPLGSSMRTTLTGGDRRQPPVGVQQGLTVVGAGRDQDLLRRRLLQYRLQLMGDLFLGAGDVPGETGLVEAAFLLRHRETLDALHGRERWEGAVGAGVRHRPGLR